MNAYNCLICNKELNINMCQIGIVLDKKLESVCMDCEFKIKNYIAESGKKVGNIDDVIKHKEEI